MKKLIIVIVMFFISGTCNLYSQTFNVDFFEGEWRWSDSSGENEFTIILKRKVYNRLKAFGGGVDDCLVGVYKYKKDGNIVVDKLSELNKDVNVVQYPIWITSYLGLGVWDYLTRNGRGEYKYMGSPFCKVEIISLDTPKQIRWILDDTGEQVVITFGDEDGEQYFFPEGTALPTDIVLTKIE